MGEGVIKYVNIINELSVLVVKVFYVSEMYYRIRVNLNVVFFLCLSDYWGKTYLVLLKRGLVMRDNIFSFLLIEI